MKNWKYIEGAKTGNETLAAHPDSAVAQEIYKIYLDNGKDENKALEVLASKYKNLPKEALKKHLKDAIKAYANIVRNSKAGNIAADITTDGNTWFVTTSDGKKKEFPSEREAEAYVKKIKTGNDTPWEYAHRKPKVINEDKTGAEEFFKQLSDDVKEREEKDDKDIEKVGNREIYVNQYEQTKAVVYEDGTIMLWDKNGNNYKKIKAGSLEEARKKLNSDYKKVGNANMETSVEKGKLGLWNWYVHKDGTIVSGGTSSTEANAKEMARKALEKEKAGNKVGNSTWYEPRRMPFQPRSLQYAYEQAKKKGLSGQKLEAEMLRIAKTTPHDSAATESEMRKDVSEWVLSHGKPEDFGNKKTGNQSYKFYGEVVDIAKTDTNTLKEILEELRALHEQGDFQRAIKDELNKRKVGNSAQDDKFAYVMREFDEGKLKTPDGKVVTDPAQAKAIAYSESKKTENGLARARKAMNKKCGNSQVTLWKGNDSVLISEDGTVQYLESNSFETDRDKYGSMQEAIDDLTKKGYRKK
jgi:hypothetical protein